MGEGVGSGTATSNPLPQINIITCCHSERSEACLVGRQEYLIFLRIKLIWNDRYYFNYNLLF
jgi:hypothetical protein